MPQTMLANSATPPNEAQVRCMFQCTRSLPGRPPSSSRARNRPTSTPAMDVAAKKALTPAVGSPLVQSMKRCGAQRSMALYSVWMTAPTNRAVTRKGGTVRDQPRRVKSLPPSSQPSSRKPPPQASDTSRVSVHSAQAGSSRCFFSLKKSLRAARRVSRNRMARQSRQARDAGGRGADESTVEAPGRRPAGSSYNPAPPLA